MNKEDKYSKLLVDSGLFFYGHSKGSFILPSHGYALWKNIQNSLDKKFAKHGIKNVLLPTLIPFELLEKEKQHIAGFSPECFYVEKIGEKKLENSLVLRPTSEVLFYDWYRQILQSYQQLPFLYNQWCSVFRAEKNTNPFFRNTEFLWQEGHTLHSNEKEARELTLSILTDYQDYAENILGLGIIVGRKSEGEKFAGALESYTVECLLPDGQCLQLATSHYFGDNFCRLMNVKFQNKDNQIQYPFSTSWGTSTRAIGAVVKTHADNWGLVLPFDIAPIQIAFIVIGQSEELINYYQEIYSMLSPIYRCQLYNKNSRFNLNILQADKEGCPFKIILGKEEMEKYQITLVRRDHIERKITIDLEINEWERKLIPAYEKYMESLSELLDDKTKEQMVNFQGESIQHFKKNLKQGKLCGIIGKENEKFQKKLSQKSIEFRDNHMFPENNLTELKNKIKNGVKGLFLIPFCNDLNCEKKMKDQVISYSIRYLPILEKKNKKIKKCLFCQSDTEIVAYLGRSY